MSDATQRTALAERAARAGGVVARESFRDTVAIETKETKNDLVTAADRDAQRQVIATIRQEFPGDSFVCEEESLPMGPDGEDAVDLVEGIPDRGDAWVVDPIDGTANYVRGFRFWATSVAALVDGTPVGVATYLPAEGDIYTAGPESVTRNGNRMQVSERTDPETFAVGLSGWWRVGEGDRHADLFRAATERLGDVRRLGCMQGCLALVAAGGLEAAFVPQVAKPWDTIAGVHLIRRAGGTATDLAGEPWEHDSDGLVVSNGTAHDVVLTAVQDLATAGTAD
ncbi:inositol monophosphatase family protein [Halobacteriales archaeon Cl-PHB]